MIKFTSDNYNSFLLVSQCHWKSTYQSSASIKQLLFDIWRTHS